jgi:multiple sugar transport system substrate-binding protein
MRRLPIYLTLLATLALLVAAGCGGSSSTATTSPTATSTSHTPVTLTVTHLWTVPSEKKGFETAIAGFEKQYPWITLKISTYANSDEFDQNLIKWIKAGTAPDVAISFLPDYVGKYAADGLWMDLKPFMQRDNFDMTQLAPGAVSYTSYGGKQVALPVLADAYGLYYNKDLFAKAGLTEPPKTMSQLMDYAKKLTVRKSDGSIDIAGFVPLNAFMEFTTSDVTQPWGAKWFDANGTPQFAGDPGWAAGMQWQKELVDWYGYPAIQKFAAAWNDKEWTPDQVFESGKVAMVFDGEWRTKMIANEKPNLNYGTAPFPAADDHPELYGQGRVSGTITGIPQGTKHPYEAWLLVKYMATDTNFLVTLANMLGNVPTTKDSAASPNLKLPPEMKAFIDVWNNPNSSSAPPLKPTGATYADYLNSFDDKWVKGTATDLQAGLRQVDQQVANELSMGQAP